MLAPAASSATGPVIELALSSAARSGSGLYLETPYLNENHSHLAPITHFCPNVKGFFAFFALFFWVFFLTFHVEPVILAM